jgi:hypothetical protein
MRRPFCSSAVYLMASFYISDYAASKGLMRVNTELEMIWEEVIEA